MWASKKRAAIPDLGVRSVQGAAARSPPERVEGSSGVRR